MYFKARFQKPKLYFQFYRKNGLSLNYAYRTGLPAKDETLKITPNIINDLKTEYWFLSSLQFKGDFDKENKPINSCRIQRM